MARLDKGERYGQEPRGDDGALDNDGEAASKTRYIFTQLSCALQTGHIRSFIDAVPPDRVVDPRTFRQAMLNRL